MVIIGTGYKSRRSLCCLSNKVDVCVGELRRNTTKSNSGYFLSRSVLERGASWQQTWISPAGT